jgi:hypothetical protein
MEEIQERYVMLCHHCGNSAPHKLVHYQVATETVYTTEGEPFGVESHYFLVECETCSDVSLLGSAEYEDFPLDWSQAHLLYPQSKQLPSSIPERVRKTYLEASRISKIAPNAFAGQIRRALEYLCLDKKATRGTLHEMVKDLAANGIIPPTLAEMTEGIRILGNVGVHATEGDLSPSDVATMDDFFKAVLEYVYIAPSKIEKLKERLSEIKK